MNLFRLLKDCRIAAPPASFHTSFNRKMSKKLNELRPRGTTSNIEVRVYRKWTNSNPPDPTPTGYSCMLLDKEGNAIQANMDFIDKDYFDRLIETGGCYRISDYICERGKQWMMIVPHETTLKFGKFTKFEHITDEDFPSHYFNFVSLNQLQPRLNRHQILTDYMASLRSVSDVKKSGNPNKNTNVWRILELENLNGHTIQFTIWDEMAKNFDVQAYINMPKPVLIAVSSCRVTMYQGNLQLTVTPSTHYYLNPDIEDVHMSFLEYQQKYDVNPPLEIQKQPFNDPELEKMRNRYPLRTLLNQDPKRYKTDKFTTEATIVDVITTLDWYYIGCPDCSKKLQRSDGSFECHNHGPLKREPKHMYNFKAYIADETAQIPITFFSPMADTLTNIDCNKMVVELGYTDPRILPDPILKLKGIKKIFQFHFNQSSNIGNVNFILDKVMEITTENDVNKKSQPKSSTPPDENYCIETHEQVTQSASILNKRKYPLVDEEVSTATGKHVKKALFHEKDVEPLNPNLSTKTSDTLIMTKTLETHKKNE